MSQCSMEPGSYMRSGGSTEALSLWVIVTCRAYRGEKLLSLLFRRKIFELSRCDMQGFISNIFATTLLSQFITASAVPRHNDVGAIIVLDGSFRGNDEYARSGGGRKPEKVISPPLVPAPVSSWIPWTPRHPILTALSLLSILAFSCHSARALKPE